MIEVLTVNALRTIALLTAIAIMDPFKRWIQVFLEMEILDTTIVNVALPHIAGSLSASNDEAAWALTSYLCSLFVLSFNELIARYERTLTAMGRAASAVHDIAVGNAYQVFRVQAAVLAFAYSDVYLLAAVVACAVVPVCFFLSGNKGGVGAVH